MCSRLALVDPVAAAVGAAVAVDDKAASAWLPALALTAEELLGGSSLVPLMPTLLLLLEVVQLCAPPHSARLQQWLARLRDQCALGPLPFP